MSIIPLKTRPARERGERAGDDGRLRRLERAALVDEPRDRLREHGADDARRDRAGTRSGAGRARPCRGSPPGRRAPRAARATGRARSRSRRRTSPAAACRAGTPCRSRSARGSGRSAATRRASRRRALKLISPSPSVTGTISSKHPRDGRVAPVDHDAQAPVEAAQPRHRQQHLDHGADEDRDRVDVELAVDRVAPAERR